MIEFKDTAFVIVMAYCCCSFSSQHKYTIIIYLANAKSLSQAVASWFAVWRVCLIIRGARGVVLSTWCVWQDLDQTGAQYSATEYERASAEVRLVEAATPNLHQPACRVGCFVNST